ncbi:MAG: alanine--tRNA ligase [Metamycoplasmataceae bacterium]
MKTSKEIRQAWIDYFVSKKHLFLESKSLVPYKDDSLLWINSGVATLKDYFSGKKNPPSKRIVNSQKSLRTNDVENVGITSRHHTFFEMLGNFSIGDYFKNEAIEFADEFLTKIIKFDKEKLFITYYEKDTFVKEKWLSLGYKETNIIAGSKDLNFWDIGEGPCGPCTEIFYDRGIKYDKKGKELIEKDIENDRFIEIWNIVFSEFNNLGNGEYVPLSQKNIDTGAGLERIVSIIQDGPTNFDTDLFLPIIYAIEKQTQYSYKKENYFEKNKEQTKINMYFKVIADHLRAFINAIQDGVKPSNLSRGYIIRRLIRRAYYYGRKLEINEDAFLYKLVPIVKDTLIFPIDVKNVQKIIFDEEIKFSKTIENGKKILEIEIQKSKDFFSPDVAFKLYETYGFPIDMTKDILIEYNLKLNDEEVEKLKEKHSKVSKSLKNEIGFSKTINSLSLIPKKIDNFIGYEKLECDTKIEMLLDNENKIEKNKGISYFILKDTPFYATSGGQKADSGFIQQKENKIKVLDVFKDKYTNHIHVIDGEINSKENIFCSVDKNLRIKSMRNHSATHLTFAALRNIYNTDIIQLGSDNNPDRLTFDFPLKARPTKDEIKQIEKFVKDSISSKVEREYIVTDIDHAKEIGAILTIEEEEYLDSSSVRVVRFGKITTDLCGGTHVNNTKDIEDYKIVSVESKGTNIWRIRAITSYEEVNNYWEKQNNIDEDTLKRLVIKLKELNNKDADKFKNIKYSNSLEEKNIELNQKIDEITKLIKVNLKQKEKTNINVNEINYEIININSYSLIFLSNIEQEQLKNLSVNLREANPNSIIFLCSKNKSIIITSKKDNCKEFAEKLKKGFSISGGGNEISWQGKIIEDITIKNIKELFNK